MKKLVTIILALAMLFAMSITAFAAPATTQIQIENSTGRKYVGYKLMNVSVGVKEGVHHTDPTCDGVNHPDTCYNYSYTITNDDYRDILKKEVYTKAADALWNGQKPADFNGVTDKQIEEYLRTLSSDSGSSFGTLRMVADRLYRAILAEGLTPELTDVKSGDTIEQGYWIIAEATDDPAVLDDPNFNFSLAMLDTAGDQEVTFKPKTDYPTVTKKVQDINDSEDATIADNAWEVSADHDIGDKVPFKLTATLPSNVRAYIVRDAGGTNTHDYKLIFHDTLSAGLTLDAASVKVYMYETAHKAETNTIQHDVTAEFNVITDPTDDCSFEVSCDDIFDMAVAADITPSTVFVVYYEAELNTNATVGAAGNKNTVYLEYTNNPYTDSTGTSEESEVIVFTYGLVVNKVDAHGHALDGAQFVLSKWDPTTSQYVALTAPATNPEGTQFTWNGLDDGEYRLEESVVPDGYNQMAPMEFAITANHTDINNIVLDGEVFGADDNGDGIMEQEIINNTGAALPETGGMGTVLFITGGMMLVAMAAVFMITRKKMSIYED